MSDVLGVGLSYRPEFARETKKMETLVDFLEISPEYFYNKNTQEELDHLIDKFVLIPHSLSLSIGSFDVISNKKLMKLQNLVQRINAPFISDHLSVCRVNEYELTDFIPVFYNDETLELLHKSVKLCYENIGVPIYLENITYQFSWPNNTYSELEFWTKVLTDTDIGMLLDVSNLYINAYNHKYDPYEFFDKLPKDKIHHLHIAGYIKNNDFLIDSHSESLSKESLDLYEYIIKNAPIKSVNLERDVNVETIDDVTNDLEILKDIFTKNRL